MGFTPPSLQGRKGRVWERLFDKLDVPTAAEAHAVEYLVGE